MPSFEALKQELTNVIKAREVRRLIYFHTDHFEPWKKIPGRRQFSQENADDLVYFTDRIATIDYARRLSLFYRNVFPVVLGERAGVLRADPDDEIGFSPRSAEAERLTAQGMGYLAKNSQHDLQVHVHHEGFTYNFGHRHPKFMEYFQDPKARSFDEARLALVVKMHLDHFAAETGRALDRWFFVHGHWALNGSDAETCCIFREIEILMQLGCKGDFTFPAGRDHVNPRHHVPFFCKPISAPRGYDLPEAEAEFAYGNGAAASKFFIWSSEVDRRASSIDYYAAWVRQRLEDPLGFAREIVNHSFAVDGRLYVKTHAHSLYPDYFVGTRRPIFPHEYPGLQNLFCLLFDSAAAAGVEVEFATASEVYDQFVSAAYRPADGYMLDAAGTATKPTTIVASTAAPAAALNMDDLPAVQPIPVAIAAHVPPRRAVAAAQGAAPLLAEVPTLSGPQPSRLELVTLGRSLLKAGQSDPNWLRLQEIGQAITSQRMMDLGLKESGAAGHYLQRLNRRDVIGLGETVIAQYLIGHNDCETYVEVGSAFGFLPILLAMRGLKAVGIESDRLRHETALVILDAIVREFPDVANRVTLLHAAAPAALEKEDLSKTLLLATDFVSSSAAEHYEAFIAWLRRFGGLLIEVDRFIVRRATETERAEAITSLERAGLGEGREVFDLGRGIRFFRFDNSPAPAA